MADDYFSGTGIVNSVGDYVQQEQQRISDTGQTSLDKSVLNSETYDVNKYGTANFCYPLDLFDPKGGNVNHVRFYVNIQSDSKAEVSDLGGVSGIAPNSGVMNSIVGKSFSKATYATATGIETGIKGLIGGGLLGGNIKSALGGAAAAGAVGAGTALATTTVLEEFAGIKFGQPSKRLAGFVALYMPNQLATRYSMQWQDEEMDLAAAVATNPEVAKQIEAVMDSAGKGNVKDAAKIAGGQAGTIASAMILKASPTLSAMSRTAANPRKEQVFKGVDYRRFQFEYQFAPRDEKEAAEVLKIINLFKYHMHPEFKDASNFIYIYPSEFDIEYCFGNGPNEKLHRISSCVLTELNINYSPNGVFSTFPDGTPTQINIQMSFTELELLTKERIKKGDM
jgi:Tail-tube assembly protein